MKAAKKESVGGTFAKVGQDFKDGDRLKILDAGKIIHGDFGPRQVHKILTTKKVELNMSLNQTSINNLVDGFGSDTDEWVNKIVKVFVVRQMIGDGLKNVAYLAPEDWVMDDDGKFHNPDSTIETDENEDSPF